MTLKPPNQYHIERLSPDFDKPGGPQIVFHVCDERGRTVAVYRGFSLYVMRSIAQAQADRLNAQKARTFQDRKGHFAVMIG